MKTLSTFKIRRTFNLKSRGLILCGELLDGVINIGDSIIFNGFKSKIKIEGIEYLDFQNGDSEVGLVISEPNSDLFNQIVLENLEIIIEHGNVN